MRKEAQRKKVQRKKKHSRRKLSGRRCSGRRTFSRRWCLGGKTVQQTKVHQKKVQQQKKAQMDQMLQDAGSQFKLAFVHSAVKSVHVNEKGDVLLLLHLRWLEQLIESGKPALESQGVSSSQYSLNGKIQSWTEIGEALVKFVNPALALLVARRMQEFQRHIDDQGWEVSTSDQHFVDHVTSSHDGKHGPTWANFLRCTTPTPEEQRRQTLRVLSREDAGTGVRGRRAGSTAITSNASAPPELGRRISEVSRPAQVPGNLLGD